MMFPSPDSSKRYAVIVAVMFIVGLAPTVQAQVTIRPSLGLQSFEFLGEPLAKLPMSPGNARSLPLGGGIVGPQVGARLELDIIPNPEEGLISFPVVFEGYSLVGKTTFSLSSSTLERKQRLTFTHTANIISAGLGVKASFFDLPKLYASVEGRYNHIFPNQLTSRIFYSDNNETVIEPTVEPHPAAGRIGGNIRVGTTVAFFEPLLLDFNLNLGILNLAGKDTDPDTQRNLLTVDSEKHDPEGTISYFGIGISVIWKM